MLKTLLFSLVCLWSNYALMAQSEGANPDKSMDKPSSEMTATGQTSKEASTNPAENLDVAIIRKLRELNAKLLKTQPDTPSHAIVSKELNELSAKYHREWKFINDQKEQDKANRTLSPAEYDNWKQQKHAPKN